jgi:AcrR family transcriptional regulator
MTRSGKKTYHHGDLRKALLDDAARLLREQGEAGLSMRNLASRAGVSRTAAYHHFEGKHALLCAIAEEGFKQFGKVFFPPDLVDRDTVDEARIQRFVRDYIAFATGSSEYYDLMFGSQLWKTEQLTDTLTREAHRAFRSYVDEIRKWQASGQIAENLEPLRYAQVSWSTLHGMSRLLIDGIYVDKRSRKAMCEAAADMLWRQLNP